MFLQLGRNDEAAIWGFQTAYEAYDRIMAAREAAPEGGDPQGKAGKALADLTARAGVRIRC